MIRKNLISFQTKDSFQLDALLLLSSSDNKEDILNTPIILYIHGVLGHFLARGTPRLLPPALLEHGINSFSVNTRMAFMGQIMGVGIFDDIINDIDASLDLLKKGGIPSHIYLWIQHGSKPSCLLCLKKIRP
jgi:hypothetical protein